jgi:hypothetical protein
LIVLGSPGSTLQSLLASPAPAPENAGSGATQNGSQQTFAPKDEESSSEADDASESDSSTEPRLKPIPDTSTGATKSGGYSVPRSNFGDRTTSVQVKRAVFQAPTSRTPAVGPVDKEVLEDSGWRAARK